MEANTPRKLAIIGIGCRMPPNAASLSSFWRFLLRGGNALCPVKKDRWDWRQFFDEDPKRPAKIYAPKAAFLDADIQQFDPLVFGISPREASCMDPQQRLLLEVAWEAFEDAGIPLEEISDTTTGVFIGAFCLDHLILQMRPANRHLLNANSPASATMTILSNRISHVFNLKGPSLTLDTACSSSLVALHYACQSLRLGECEMALVGGVNIMSCPDNPIMMSKGHFLSDHGECHAFDETASGYARGEGAGIFLIKPYEKALEAGDQIHAIICETGVNQDGHTDGISLPNSYAQEKLVREVYRRAGVPPSEVDYIEAHGTGTQAGDPAEARALHVNFAEGRAQDKKLLIGSVKTNVGHLEAAAGVAGMLKAIGALKFRQIPKNLHFNHPNPKIPFAEYCLKVVEETTALPSEAEKQKLYVGINSFGYGGTNAHVLLESAPNVVEQASRLLFPTSGRNVRPTIDGGENTSLHLVPFSARSSKALQELAGKFAFLIGQGLPGSFSDLAYTTAFRRSHLEYRCAAIATNLEELREQLIAVSTGQPHEGIVAGANAIEAETKLAFVFTGMGPQWWAMGQELIRNERIVAETIEEIDEHFKKLSGWSLREAMMAGESVSRMERTEIAQPANFALQIALTRLWESYGIHPTAVVGHSVGEVVSAYVAGVYTLEEAVRVSYHRSRLQQTAAGRGAMLAIGMPEAKALELIAPFPGVSIAAVNSFDAVTLSGDNDQLQQIAATLEKQEIFQRFLRVEVAYHSPQMDPLRSELLQSLSDLSPKPAKIPLYSTAYGKIIPSEEWDADYWWRNVRQPVRFADAMRSLFEDGFSSFLEIGPHPVLGNSIKECAAHLERKVNCFVSLRRKEDELRRLLLTLGELYCAGYNPDWKTLAPQKGRFIPGPQYPWQRQHHWLESERSKMDRLGLPGPVYLNRSVLAPNPCWEVEINRNYFPFLFDHGVQDQTVFAGMAYMEAAITLNRHIHEKQAVVLENVSFEKVLVVDYSKLQYLITEFDPEAGRFNIYSRIEGEEDSAQRHCRGRMLPQSHPHLQKLDLSALRSRCTETVTIDAFHEHLDRCELHYGPTFRPIVEVIVGEDCYISKINTSITATEDSHLLHPTVFDAAIRGVLYCAKGERLFVPFSFEQFQYFSRPDSVECYAFGELISQSDTMIVANVWLMDADGNVHVHARHMSLQAIDMNAEKEKEHLFYQSEWKTAPIETLDNADGSKIIILADPKDSDLALAEELANHLPESKKVIQKFPRGFGTDAIVSLLSQEEYSSRNRFVVMWGSNDTQIATTDTISTLNEKVIGLLQALQKMEKGSIDVTLVTRGAKSVEDGEEISNLSAISVSAIGFVAQNEFESITCRSIDLPKDNNKELCESILAEIAAGSHGDIAYRNKQRFENALNSFRENGKRKFLVQSVEQPFELKLDTKGKLESLHFESAERKNPREGELELRVHSVSLNYKDLLKIDGRIHPSAFESTFNGSDFGMECAGVVVRCGTNSKFAPGDKVVTILPRGYRSYATVPETFVIKIPACLGMEAAAIPVVYMAAYHGLINTAHLRAGERLLIHHATGGLGLAAIDIARWVGAEIFVTAGSEEKQRFLHELGIQHVFSSRNLDFGQHIHEATNNEGIDVVIGAQSGQAMHSSLSLLRTGGRYIEVGKKDIVEDNSLPMRAFNRNLVFASIDMDRLAKEQPILIQKILQTIFEHFEKGNFKLGPTRFFSAKDIHEAFQEMARSRHIGKLLVDFSRGDVEVLEKPNIEPIIKRDGCYIVTGGTSGFGLTTGRWIAEQGAGKIILVSRSGQKASGIADTIRYIESQGTQIEVLSVDVTDPQQIKSLIARAASSAFVLRGIVHGAMVLDDAMMADLTEESFKRVFMPKVAGALNLAEAITGQSHLDFLVFYSSISALIGNRGQTSYVVANSFLDGLAHTLKAKGIPAVSINWGALAESGVVARSEHLGAILSSSGITGLKNQQALEALEKAIRLAKPQLGVFIIDWEKWHSANPKLANDPRFREQRIQSQKNADNDVAAQIRHALADFSKEQRLRAIEDHLQEVLANTLKMSKDAVPVNRKMNEMGVDSLMVLELSLGIKERIGVNFSAMEFLKGPNLQQLASMAESKLWNN